MYLSDGKLNKKIIALCSVFVRIDHMYIGILEVQLNAGFNAMTCMAMYSFINDEFKTYFRKAGGRVNLFGVGNFGIFTFKILQSS